MFLNQLKTSPREVRIRGTEAESVPGFFKWSVNERGWGRGCKKFRNIFTLRECTSVTRIACFETRPNVPHWPQKQSGDSASFATEFTFCTRSQEHSRGLNLSSQTTRVQQTRLASNRHPLKPEIYPRIILAFSLNHF